MISGKRIFFKLSVFFLIVIFSSNCRENEINSGEKVEGRIRVVSLAPNITEIIYAIGSEDSLAGVTRYCNYPPEAQNMPKVGGIIDINLEAIAGLKPDIVIAVRSQASEYLRESLRKSKTELLLLDFDTIEDLLKSIIIIGENLKNAENAYRLAARLKAEIRANTIETQKKQKILIVLGHRPLFIAGNGAFLNELIQRAGGINAGADSKIPYAVWSIEQVYRSLPEIIIETTMEDIKDAVEYWSEFAEIPAVKNKRIYTLNADLITRPGPRIGESLKLLKNIVENKFISL
jgi:iron complex transport system substrate-binding protein